MSRPGGPRERTPRDVGVSRQEWGSDFVADLLKAYGFEYVSYNPGASFRGLEESIVNYNDDTAPQTIQTQNESLSVSIAHGYAKATDEPALCILHDTVGTLNGAMSVYNAYVDRAPVLILGGNGPLRKSERRPWIDWIHSNLNQGALVDSAVKWHDQPVHSDGVAESLIRGHNIADTLPKGPVYVTLDHDVQENELDEPIEIPDFDAYQPPTTLRPTAAAIEEAADRLVGAEFPVILTDRVGTSRAAVEALVDLAEALGAPVVESYYYHPSRFNFPTTHPLNFGGTDIHRRADVVLTLDVQSPAHFLEDVVDSATHETEPVIEGEYELITVGTQDLEASSLTHDYCALRETALSITADTAIAIPELREAIETAVGGDAGRIEERRAELARLHDEQRQAWANAVEETWDETPVSLPRLSHELWEVIRDESWVIVNGTLRGWPFRLWEIDEFDQYIGGTSGGAGVGYGIGGAIGGALAYANTERVPINLQPDGDLMQVLSGLWTIGRYDIPLLTVVHNNGALYNSTEHRMALAAYRSRNADVDRALIGTGVNSPVPDYASIADGLGVTGYGPVEDPNNLASVLQDAWTAVTRGSPVLVDVVCQPR